MNLREFFGLTAVGILISVGILFYVDFLATLKTVLVLILCWFGAAIGRSAYCLGERIYDDTFGKENDE